MYSLKKKKKKGGGGGGGTLIMSKMSSFTNTIEQNMAFFDNRNYMEVLLVSRSAHDFVFAVNLHLLAKNIYVCCCCFCLFLFCEL